MVLSVPTPIWLPEVMSPFLAAASVALLVLSVLVTTVWLGLPEVTRRRYGPGLLWALAAGVTVAVWVGRFSGWDDLYHLHVSYLMSRGLVPFRDFTENHTPATYLLLAPLLRLLPPAVSICDFARLLSLGLASCIFALVVALARRVQGAAFSLPAVVILWLGTVVPFELYELRPDLFAAICSLSALLVLASWRGWRAALASGLLIGLAMGFTPKHAPLVALMPLWLLTQRVGFRRLLGLTAVHWSGVAAGVAPTVLWLISHGVWSEFRHWVFGFNTSAGPAIARCFPVLPVFMVVYWVARAWEAKRCLDPHEWLALLALGLAVVMWAGQSLNDCLYCLQFFALLTIVACAGELQRLVTQLAARRRALVAGVLVALFLMPSALVCRWLKHGDYFAGRAELAALAHIAGNETVQGLIPRHPITALDATRLMGWGRWMDRDDVRAALRGFADRVIATRPALIAVGDGLQPPPTRPPAGHPLLTDLRKVRAISPEEQRRLEDFISRDYRLVRVVRHYYWVRKDRALPEGCEEAGHQGVGPGGARVAPPTGG